MLNNRVFMIYPEDDDSHRRGLLFVSVDYVVFAIIRVEENEPYFNEDFLAFLNRS